MGNSFRSHFERVRVYLQGSVSEMETLGPTVCACVILTDTTKSPSVEFVPIHTPTGNVRECPFSHNLNNQVGYNKRFLILIKQISRIRELLKSERNLFYT